MTRRSKSSTSRRPVVLLVMQARDDGLDMYSQYLRYHGMVPIAVSEATNALVRAGEADVIVTGIILDGPDDGVELVSRLRADVATRHTPIIVLTACASAKDHARAAHAGCDVFLPKPCLPNDLLFEVRKLFLRARRQRHNARTDASAPLGRDAQH